jgi:hypothetical protein
MAANSVSDLLSGGFQAVKALLDPTHGLSLEDQYPTRTEQWAGNMIEGMDSDGLYGISYEVSERYRSAQETGMSEREVIYNLGIAGGKMAEKLDTDEEDLWNLYGYVQSGLPNSDRRSMGRSAKEAVLRQGFTDYWDEASGRNPSEETQK